MNRHTRTYELYCSVVGRNIIIEETMFHNGTKSAKCLNKSTCEKNGGCTNRILSQKILKIVEK
ncbi:MAG: hypothetical protein BWY46_01123 [Firmicutes bacterium ADurb.Bin300]|nr:MAG: hypothetical protein BWY46_01123 [Firmicutes bacterium ADurb.Bin300]